MSILLVTAVAIAMGWMVRRWWLLTLPLAMAAGAALLLVMPGSGVTADNPLPFLTVLLEVGLVVGIVAGRRRAPRS